MFSDLENTCKNNTQDSKNNLQILFQSPQNGNFFIFNIPNIKFTDFKSLI